MVKKNIKKILFSLIILLISIFAIWGTKRAVGEQISMAVHPSGQFWPSGAPPTYGWYCVSKNFRNPQWLTNYGTMLIYHDHAVSSDGVTQIGFEADKFSDINSYPGLVTRGMPILKWIADQGVDTVSNHIYNESETVRKSDAQHMVWNDTAVISALKWGQGNANLLYAGGGGINASLYADEIQTFINTASGQMGTSGAFNTTNFSVTPNARVGGGTTGEHQGLSALGPIHVDQLSGAITGITVIAADGVTPVGCYYGTRDTDTDFTEVSMGDTSKIHTGAQFYILINPDELAEKGTSKIVATVENAAGAQGYVSTETPVRVTFYKSSGGQDLIGIEPGSFTRGSPAPVNFEAQMTIPVNESGTIRVFKYTREKNEAGEFVENREKKVGGAQFTIEVLNRDGSSQNPQMYVNASGVGIEGQPGKYKLNQEIPFVDNPNAGIFTTIEDIGFEITNLPKENYIYRVRETKTQSDEYILDAEHQVVDVDLVATPVYEWPCVNTKSDTVNTEYELDIYKYQEGIQVADEHDEENTKYHLGSTMNVLLPGAKFIVYMKVDWERDHEVFEQLGISQEEAMSKYDRKVLTATENEAGDFIANYDSNWYSLSNYDTQGIMAWNMNDEAPRHSFIPPVTEVINGQQGRTITAKDAEYPLIDSGTHGVIKLKGLVPGAYFVKEVDPPETTTGSGEEAKLFNEPDGIGYQQDANGNIVVGPTKTEIARNDIDGNTVKDDETYNDFVIDESGINGIPVYQDAPIAENIWRDETAAGLHIRKYKYQEDRASEYVQNPKDPKYDEINAGQALEGQKFTIQFAPADRDRENIIRDDEEIVSGYYQGKFLDPNAENAWIGDYKSKEGAKLKTYYKEDIYRDDVTSHEDAVEKNCVFETNADGEIFLRNLIPGTYIIREVNDSGLRRVDAFTETKNGQSDESRTYTITEEGGDNSIEKVVEDGVEIFTRKREYHHPTVTFYNDEGLVIEKTDEKDNFLKGAKFAIQLVTAANEEDKSLEGKCINPLALKEESERTVELDSTKSDAYIDSAEGLDSGNVEDSVVAKYGVEVKTGRLRVKGIKPGKYKVIELKAPPGYRLSAESYIQEVEVVDLQSAMKSEEAESKNKATIKDKQDGGKLIIEKVDTDDQSKKLSGAQFTVKLINAADPNIKVHPVDDENAENCNGCYVNAQGEINWFENYQKAEATLTTGSDGRISIKNMIPGTYEVTEVSPPSGYEISGEATKQVPVEKASASTQVASINSEATEETVEIASIEGVNSATRISSNVTSRAGEAAQSGNIIINNYKLSDKGEVEGGNLGGGTYVIFNKTTRQFVQIPRSVLLAQTYGEEITKEKGYDKDTGTYTIDYYQPETSGNFSQNRYDEILKFRVDEGLPLILNNLAAGDYVVMQITPPVGYDFAKNGDNNDAVMSFNIPRDSGKNLDYHNKLVDISKSIVINNYALDRSGNRDFTKGILSATYVIRDTTTQELVKVPTGANYNETLQIFTASEYIKETEAKTADGNDYIPEVKFTSKQDYPIILQGLKSGRYEIEEIKAPAGYMLARNGMKERPTVMQFNIFDNGTPDNKGAHYDYHSEPITRDITIRTYAAKSDGTADTSKELEGARFVLQWVSDDEEENEKHPLYVKASGLTLENSEFEATGLTYDKNDAGFITGNQGDPNRQDKSIKLKGLRSGTYKVIEDIAPNGYRRSADQMFIINEEGRVLGADGVNDLPNHELHFINDLGEPTDLSLEIYKYQEKVDIAEETSEADNKSNAERENVLLAGASYAIIYHPDVNADYFKNKGTAAEINERYMNVFVIFNEDGTTTYTTQKVSNYTTDTFKGNPWDDTGANWCSYLPETYINGKLTKVDEPGFPLTYAKKGMVYGLDVLPGTYYIKEVKAPPTTSKGTGEPGIDKQKTLTAEEADKQINSKKDAETRSDWVIDESPAQIVNVNSATNEGLSQVTFRDETATGLHIKTKNKDDKSVKGKQFTIQLIKTSDRQDEKRISQAYEGCFMNPNALEGYNTREGARINTGRKNEVYIEPKYDGYKPGREIDSHEKAVEAGYVFTTSDADGEIYIRNVVPGTYKIREVTPDDLQKVRVETKKKNGGEDEIIEYGEYYYTEGTADPAYLIGSVEKVKQQGVEVFTRKKEYSHPVVTFYSEGGDLADNPDGPPEGYDPTNPDTPEEKPSGDPSEVSSGDPSEVSSGDPEEQPSGGPVKPSDAPEEEGGGRPAPNPEDQPGDEPGEEPGDDKPFVEPEIEWNNNVDVTFEDKKEPEESPSPPSQPDIPTPESPGTPTDITPVPGTGGYLRKVILKAEGVGLEKFRFKFDEKRIDEENYPEVINNTEFYQHDGATTHCHFYECEHQDSWVSNEFEPGGGHCVVHGYHEASHIPPYEERRKAFNDSCKAANSAHEAREAMLTEHEHLYLTDENGYIYFVGNIIPEGDDGKGRFTADEDGVVENPYFDVEGPTIVIDDTSSQYLHKNERIRMDLEGFVFLDVPEESKRGDSPNDGDHIYGSGDEKVSPVEVRFISDDGIEYAKPVMTGPDGKYRLRINLKDEGGNRKSQRAIEDVVRSGYIEFTYNGMKYQSVFSPTLEDTSNGSHALEKLDDRQSFNDRFKTIVSDNGQVEQNNIEAGDTSIKFEPNGTDPATGYVYKRKVRYEGKVSGAINASGEAADPCGNGEYTTTNLPGRTPEPGASQEQDNSKDDGYADPGQCGIITSKQLTDNNNKYQIKADTQTAGEQRLSQYNVDQDTIKDINLGLFTRTQPDISITNDIEQIQVMQNGYIRYYQYEEKTNDQATVDQYLGNEEYDERFKTNKKSEIKARFQDNYTFIYRREVYPSEVQLIPEINPDKPIEIHVIYKTIISNQAGEKFEMRPTELVSFYDNRYAEIKDVTQEMFKYYGKEAEYNAGGQFHVDSWNDSSQFATGNQPIGAKQNTEERKNEDASEVSSQDQNTELIEKGGLSAKYAYINDEQRYIPGGQSRTIYTDYKLEREPMTKLFTNDGREYGVPLLLYNYIEVNAYTTHRHQESERPGLNENYGSIDLDSVAGNHKPDDFNTYEDDNDDAPVFDLSLTDSGNRVLEGNVFEDIAKEEDSGAISGAEAQQWIGNGLRDGEDKSVKHVRVELVELEHSGDKFTERLSDVKDQSPNGEYQEADNLTAYLRDTNQWSYDSDFQNPEENNDYDNGFSVDKDVRRAVVYTDENGNYSLSGFYPGNYIVKYTWGKDSVIVGKEITEGTGEAKTYPQQYKATTFNDQARYDKETGEVRWWLDHSDYENKSSATDEMAERVYTDEQTEVVGNGDDTDRNLDASDNAQRAVTYPSLERTADGEKDDNLALHMTSRTARFEIPLEDEEDNIHQTPDKVPTTNDITGGADTDELNAYTDGDLNNGKEVVIKDLDFGIVERPTQDMTIDKKIERMRVVLQNGNVLIDTTTDGDDDHKNQEIKGSFVNSIYIAPEANVKNERDNSASEEYGRKVNTLGTIGTLKSEIDKEIMYNSTLEIKYNYKIKNEGYVDFITASNTNKESNDLDIHYQDAKNNTYYTFTDSAPDPSVIKPKELPGGVDSRLAHTTNQVEARPTMILDFLDKKLDFRKTPDETPTLAPKENDSWERISPNIDGTISEGSNKSQRERILDHMLDNEDFSGNELYEAKVEAGEYQNNVLGGAGQDNSNPDKTLANNELRLQAINQKYLTVLRDATAQNINDLLAESGQINATNSNKQYELDFEDNNVFTWLKAGEEQEIKFTAQKVLSEDDNDQEFFNAVELLQLQKTAGEIPEYNMEGNLIPTQTPTISSLLDPSNPTDSDKNTFDLTTRIDFIDPEPANGGPTDDSGNPNQDRIEIEADASTAAVTTITPPTGKSASDVKLLKEMVESKDMQIPLDYVRRKMMLKYYIETHK